MHYIGQLCFQCHGCTWVWMGKSAEVLLGEGTWWAGHSTVHRHLWLWLRVHGSQWSSGYHTPHWQNLPHSHTGNYVKAMAALTGLSLFSLHLWVCLCSFLCLCLRLSVSTCHFVYFLSVCVFLCLSVSVSSCLLSVSVCLCLSLSFSMAKCVCHARELRMMIPFMFSVNIGGWKQWCHE